MDKSVETGGKRYTPSKKEVGSRVVSRPSSTKGGLKKDLVIAAGVAGATTGGLLAGLHSGQAKDAINYVPDHFPLKKVERSANESLEARYAKLDDPRDRENDVDVDLLYPNLTDQEKVDLNSQLQNERSIIREEYLPGVSMENVEMLLPLIEQSAKDEGFPRDILFGMILIESKFDPYNFNKESGAKGLTQMMDSMAQVHGLNISYANVANETYDEYTDVDDRYKPEIILPATAKELAQ